MRRLKLVVFGLFCSVLLAWGGAAAQRRAGYVGNLRNNSCVKCHSSLREPLKISVHFFDWKNSRHDKAGVSCEKCHGGDPAAATIKAAHIGVSSPSAAGSPLSAKELQNTCGKCHGEIVKAFANSAHGLNFQAGVPNCSTCHQHMATSVISWPPETTKLCASCHRANGGNAGALLDVPAQAGDTIAAFSRADGVVEWAYYLLKEARSKKMNVAEETRQVDKYARILREAKIRWHQFDLKSSRVDADEVFVRVTEIKDALWKKLPG